MGDDVRGGEGFLRGGAVAEGEFGGVSADPGGDCSGLEGCFALGEEGGSDSRERVAHASAGHAGVSGGVVGVW